MRTTTRFIAAAVPAALLVTLVGPAASAAPPPPDQLVERALSVVAREQPSALAVLGDADLTVTTTKHQATVRTPDGDRFTIKPSDPADSVIRTYPDGVQVMTVLRDGERSTSFDLGLPDGFEVQEEGDGTLALVLEEDGVRVEFGTVEQPWAVDAAGKMVETTYEVVGDRLVQHIHGDDVSYPVVADPRLTFGRYVYLNLYGWEINNISAAVIASGGGAVVAVCGGIANIPAGVTKVVKVLCQFMPAVSVAIVLNEIVQHWRRNGIVHNACYQKPLGVPGGITKVAVAGNCRA